MSPRKPDIHLKDDETAMDIIKCVQSHDMGSREGKRALWVILNRCGAASKTEHTALKQRYIQEGGLDVGEAFRLAALDVAATLPSADALPAGLLESLRPGADEVERVEGQQPFPWKHGTTVKSGAEGFERGQKQETLTDRLVNQVEDLSDGKPVGIARSVVWVSAHIRTPLNRLRAEDVPGPEALAMLLWARGQNETEYRRVYDSKRIPSKGLAEEDDKGFIDTGAPIEDIMRRIGAGIDEFRSAVNVSTDSVRHLQASDTGRGDGGEVGGVSGVSGGSVEG
jgi:hypothetical protein